MRKGILNALLGHFRYKIIFKSNFFLKRGLSIRDQEVIGTEVKTFGHQNLY